MLTTDQGCAFICAIPIRIETKSQIKQPKERMIDAYSMHSDALSNVGHHQTKAP